MPVEATGAATADRTPTRDGTRRRRPRVGDLASQPVVSISPDRSLRAAAKAMDQHGIGAVVVLRGDGLEGILTERDLLHAMAHDVDPDTATVEQHLTADVITVGRDWEVFEAAAEMADHHIRHLVVIDGAEVCGVLSVRDVLLAGQRIELGAGAWVVLRDPLTFTVRERRRLQHLLLSLDRGPTAVLDLDALITELIGSWSFPTPPSVESVAALDPADHRVLRAAVEQELPSLQRAVHPAPGWRRWQ